MIRLVLIVMLLVTRVAAADDTAPDTTEAPFGPSLPPAPSEAPSATPSESPSESNVSIDQPLPRLTYGHEQTPSLVPVQLHINTGFEIGGSGRVISSVWRTHVGMSFGLGSGRVRPQIAAGAVFGAGELSAQDPRALDGSVNLGYLDMGPEVQVGLRFAHGGAVDSRIFASAAYLKTDVDKRLMLDSVDNIGGTRGMRYSIGMNWAGAVGHRVMNSHEKDDESWLLFLVPQQLELQWLDSVGSRRVGVTFSYGI